MRMASICISDGLLPDASPKLRQVLRKAFRVQRDSFGITDPAKQAEMTLHLADIVLESLAYHYPETDFQKDIMASVMEFEVDHMIEQDKKCKDAMKKIVKMVSFKL